VWGLAPVEARNNSRYFRGTGRYHHVLGLHRAAQPAVIRVAFDVADRGVIDRLHRDVAASGSRPSAPAQSSAPAAAMPSPAKTRTAATSFSSAIAPIMSMTPTKATGRARSRMSTSMRATSKGALAFFTKALDFRLIDENAPLWFLHCANTDHCSIVLAKTDLPTLNHVAFEMPELDSVMRGMGRMKDAGYPIEWGPGRHGPGQNVFAYFCGPDEVPLEYTAEVLQIDDSYEPRSSSYWKFAPGRSDQWGITQPRSARYYRVQRLFGFTADGDRIA
jgi:catechol 2,3-dioxygenase